MSAAWAGPQRCGPGARLEGVWAGVGAGGSHWAGGLPTEEEPQTQSPKPQPAVPPRPSADLILHRCSESTKRKLASSV